MRGVTEHRGATVGQEQCDHCKQPRRDSALALVMTWLGHESGERSAYERGGKL